jgi:hypothetical protein
LHNTNTTILKEEAKMKKAAVLLLGVVMMTAMVGFCLAEASLQDLQAKAAGIKAGPDGHTEAQVRALMGEPKSVEIDEKIVGAGRVLKRKLLSYGPNGEIIVIIDAEYGYVRAVK